MAPAMWQEPGISIVSQIFAVQRGERFVLGPNETFLVL
jgi:uncharacterized protein with PhoU and TrkA domain